MIDLFILFSFGTNCLIIDIPSLKPAQIAGIYKMIITPTNDVNNTTSSVSPFDSYHAVNWFVGVKFSSLKNSNVALYIKSTYVTFQIIIMQYNNILITTNDLM